MGRHSRPQRRTIETIELVDTSGTAHRVRIDAAADGLRRGSYATVCGTDVVAAPLVAKQTRYCRLCAPIPAQRTWGARR
jgi:hypothetical protein